jgi:multiple sugar transport system substrate-binding protein
MRNVGKYVLLSVVLVGFILSGVATFAEDTTLRVGWWTNQKRTERTLKVMEMYRKANPEITFEPEYQGWGQYWDKLTAQIAGNDLPDIIQQDLIYLKQYADKGLIIPLDDVAGLDLSEVDAGVIDTGKVDGTLYGVCIGTSAIALVFDPVIFEKAGVSEPTVDWTWDDYVQAALTIHEKLGIYGADFIEVENFLPFWLREKGATLYSADGKGLGYADDTLVVEFLDMLVRLQKAEAMPGPDYWTQVKANEAMQYYALGEAGMTFMWASKIGEVYKTKQQISQFMIIPGPNNDKGMYVKPSMFLSITANAKNVEAAARFISWWVSDVEATKALEAGRGIPVTPAGRKAMGEAADEQTKLLFEYMDLVAAHSSSLDPPDPQAAAEVREAFANIATEAMFGKISTADAAAKFREQAEAALSR